MSKELYKTIAEKAHEMRKTSIELGNAAGKNGAHFGPALGCIDIVASLYFGVMKNDPKNPQDPKRDRFVLSKGHACLALYSVLMEAGYISKDLIPTFKGNATTLGGHPSMSPERGIEISSGSLGNGFAVACGMAQGAKLKGEDHSVFVLVGDGECNEGVVCEAAMNAVQHKLDNLITIIDINGFQLSGTTEDVMDLDIEKIWGAFGYEITHVKDGNDPENLVTVLNEVKAKRNGVPQLVLAHTVKGKGVSFMEKKLQWHASPISKEQYAQAKSELGM